MRCQWTLSFLCFRTRRSCFIPLASRTSETMRARHYARAPEYDKLITMDSYDNHKIKNFSIIAHVDHGKSTLADRMLELTGATIGPSNRQVLDTLQVERERGITVKAQTASLFYNYKEDVFLLNLIDTPGHVDFSYEVSRSLSACEGVVLLVDATQGIQAQTLTNYFHSKEANLCVIPAVNKIDMKNADVEGVVQEMCTAFDFDDGDILRVSAKTGQGVPQLMEAIIQRIPSPKGKRDTPTKCQLVDSWYEQYRGVISVVKVTSGVLSRGQQLTSFYNNQEYKVHDIGILQPKATPTDKLLAGQVGYVVFGIRDPSQSKIGDTYGMGGAEHTQQALIKPAKPVVFAGVFPIDSDDYENVKSAISKLTLNDSSVSYEITSSAALGQGWKVGFLGVLHMDIFLQRLEQEYSVTCIVTSPNVTYKAILKKTDRVIDIRTPAEFPEKIKVSEYLEPFIVATIITPDVYIGKIIDLCMHCRGTQLDMTYIGSSRVLFKYKFPLSEIMVDFYDTLKSISSGFASFDYEEDEYIAADLVKMDILLNGVPVDVMATIVHRSKAFQVGKSLCQRLSEVIHRQLYEVAIQASIGGRVIARETVKPLRKDVTAKCYGGDITRKRKLLEKQKEGKKRMKQLGKIELPKDSFLAVLKRKE